MFENINVQGLGQFMLVYTAVCCVLPMLVLGVGVILAYRHGSSFLNSVIVPDVERMQAGYERLRQKNPQKSADELVAIIIRRQSFRCGMVGAIAGVAGPVTLPITLPVDIVMSYRIQGAMVNFIARAYERNPLLPNEDATVSSIVMFGTSRLTQSSTKAALNVIGEVTGRTLAKFIPVAGAIIGFIVNYVTTEATGRVAAEVYSGRIQERGGSALQRAMGVFRRRKKGKSSEL